MVQFQFDGASVASDGSFDDDSFTSDVTEQANQMETTQTEQVKEVEQMSKKETNNMRAWKLIVVLTIIVTASLVSAGTYIFLKQNEDSTYDESVSLAVRTHSGRRSAVFL